jgi:hypothetical protein
MSSKLMNILSVERARSYNTWISVGWCVRNIDNRLLENWIQFSKRSSKFVDDVSNILGVKAASFLNCKILGFRLHACRCWCWPG